jgi:tRNA nucleotidyltransferase (CCA-adding enzyme)
VTAGLRWEHFPHQADVGIRGVGPSLEAALGQAALALTAVVTDPARVEPRDELTIACEASNPDDLFFDWLDALVGEMSTRRMLFGEFDVRVEDHHLTARVRGEPIDRARHQPAVEVKGPTYTALRVFSDAETGEWTAECVVDV